jgi:phage-related protein
VTEYSSSAQDAFTQFFTEIGPAFGRTFESLGRDLENSFEGFDDRFNSAINSFAVSFSGAITDFINAIGPAFSQFFNDIGPALEIAFGGLITGIVDGISNVFMPIENALLGLADMIRQFADSITPQNIGGSGGGKGVISEFLGLAKGGIVYAAQGTLAKGTDTVPAMLTPGELVVPRDMVSELGAYLSAQRDTSGASNTAMLASILSEVQKPIVVQAEAKVNQSAFADIILQLNRQNARLTA